MKSWKKRYLDNYFKDFIEGLKNLKKHGITVRRPK